MGNKPHGGVPPTKMDSLQASQKQQPVQQPKQSSLSIFNCMAIQGHCCQDGEQASIEVDNSRYHQISDPINLKKKQTFSPTIGIEKMTLGSENCFSEYNALSLRTTENRNIHSQPQIGILSGRKVSKGSKNYNKIAQILDNRSQAFNNRNNRVMTGVFGDTNREGHYGTVSSRHSQLKQIALQAVQTQEHLAKASLNVRKIGTARSGRQDYNTPQERSPFYKRDQRGSHQGKIAFTEVARSEGDHSIPLVEIVMDDRRGMSPESQLPLELQNLDHSIEIEVQSTHSARLYRDSGVRMTKKKTPLFPELSRIKPYSKEVSKTKKEFKKGNVVPYKPSKRASFNQERNQRPGNRLTQITGQLPQEIQSFLENAKEKYPTLSLQNGVVYIGEMKNQKLNGLGFWLQADNSYYFGEWSDGKRQGQGTYQHANGTMYRGSWIANNLEGLGICRNPDGTFYEGEWENMQPHGKGHRTFPDQSFYKGNFKYGMKSGNGTLNCPDGSIYKGQFEDNQINGRGLYTWPHGIQYEGMWVDNKKQGQGVLKWLDGSREYSGDFMDDERHGHGTYIWENGTKSYRGYWRNGLKDGIGYVRDEFDYSERKGLWFCGKLVKWMPMEDEDEGQDGESLKSADIRDWEGPSGNFNEQKVRELHTSGRATLQPQSHNSRVNSQRDSQEVSLPQPVIQTSKATPEVMQQKTLQIDIPNSRPTSQGNNSLGPKRILSNNTSSRLQPAFRKAAEEVKTLKTRRKPISRKTVTEESAFTRASQKVAQSKNGIVPLDNKVKLVSRDLLEFNHPEVYREMEKKMMNCNEMPSPQFNKEISFIKSMIEEEEKEEYFQFNPEAEDVDDDSF